MPKILKLSLLSLIITMLVFSTISAAPANTSKKQPEEQKLNNQLRELGVPEERIATMYYDLKKDIAENAIKYIGYNMVSGDLDQEVNEGTIDDIQPFGTIPSEDFNFWIDVTQTSNSSDGRERYNVFLNYDWLDIPFWRLSDPYGIAWDSALFRIVPDSYNNHDYYYTSYSGWQVTQNIYAKCSMAEIKKTIHCLS